MYHRSGILCAAVHYLTVIPTSRCASKWPNKVRPISMCTRKRVPRRLIIYAMCSCIFLERHFAIPSEHVMHVMVLYVVTIWMSVCRYPVDRIWFIIGNCLHVRGSWTSLLLEIQCDLDQTLISHILRFEAIRMCLMVHFAFAREMSTPGNPECGH